MVEREQMCAGAFAEHEEQRSLLEAKGLKFTFVLLPGLHEGAFERWDGEPDDGLRERAERMRRELYVG